MEPVVLALKEKYGQEVNFIVADVSTEEGASLAREYGVTLIPAIFVLDRQGNTVFADVGIQSRELLSSKIDQAIRD